LADPQHHVPRICAPAALAPLLQLLDEIAGWLARKWRIGRAQSRALGTMTASARRQAPLNIASVIKGRTGLFARACDGCERQVGIEERHLHPLARAEVSRDPSHLCVVAISLCVGIELPLEVSRVEASDARGSRAITFTRQPVAGKTGVRRPGARAAKRDQLAAPAETIERSSLGGGACRHRRRQQNGEDRLAPHARQTARRHAGFRCALLALAVAACKPPPVERQSLAQGDPANGLAAIERVGCGSCHRIPDVSWPRGTVGPALTGLADRALIAGKLPNRPDVLAAFIRNAPALVPGSAMPAMPVTEMEARDIAAYLYEAEAQ
jgi:mono/diheme cytochrome c family protein